ncbi:MAG: arsenate reductase ArsC [Gemmatimonadales bacterium]|nr:arsenate reductase ArsC [Gemmatimonadales bacterium]
MSDAVTRVLVLCTANAARSQIAEALFVTIGGTRVDVASAGSNPGAGPHPLAVAVLAERGIAWHDRTSKGIDSMIDRQWDLVITVCDNAREACPVIPGSRMLHWGLPDPADAGIEAFRDVAAELERRIRLLLVDLQPGP